MEEKIEQILKEAEKEISNSKDREEVFDIEKKYLGKKGSLSQILKDLGKLSPDERKTIGKRANEIKNEIQIFLLERNEKLLSDETICDRAIDLTKPGSEGIGGGLHPITQMCYDLNEAFFSQGFELYEDNEISSELFSFDHLNFPPDHPARESMDTYWLFGTDEKKGNERLALRPHLTGGSVRYLLEKGAPARFIYPGRVYRAESTDRRHERAFYQYEALIVEKDFSFASGKILVDTILEKVFGYKVNTRMRAGFFPFVEPGFEIDMECGVCHGKGCSVCKNVGWIEVMPGGSPHPNVLKSAGLDPKVWSGFYINIGLDRLVMMRYGVDDVRLFHSADIRFISQFK